MIDMRYSGTVLGIINLKVQQCGHLIIDGGVCHEQKVCRNATLYVLQVQRLAKRSPSATLA
jgi:hypothetical protein